MVIQVEKNTSIFCSKQFSRSRMKRCVFLLKQPKFGCFSVSQFQGITGIVIGQKSNNTYCFDHKLSCENFYEMVEETASLLPILVKFDATHNHTSSNPTSA